MKNIVFSKCFIFLLSIFFTISVNNSFAGSVDIPNTFSSGATAMASEVNANFSAIETAVDDNDSRITTNAGNISSNDTDIATNGTDIADLKNRSWELSGSDLYYNNGNVAIGNATPGSILLQ